MRSAVTIVVYSMIYLGSALMIFNIYRYLRFARSISRKGGWAAEERLLKLPIALLICFLLGYLAVGLFGEPDLIIAGILFGGSVFVFAMIIFMEKVIRRVQEQEHLEAELAAAEESSRTKTGFLSRISHEMRTPMNAIIGLSNMALKDPDLSERTRECLIKLRVNTNLMMELINDTLEMGRIQSGTDELLNEVFSLTELLGRICAIFEAQCKDKGLNYRQEVKGTLESAYLGDPMKLRQIFVNLLGNAVKFTPAPGSVRCTVETVSSYENHRTLRITVSDSGIGMDEKFLPKLFQPFSQEDESTTNQYRGSGLGLAITKSLVERMNGEISVKSAKGMGSTITVILTLDSAPPDAVIPQEPGTEEFIPQVNAEEQIPTSQPEQPAEEPVVSASAAEAQEGWPDLEGAHVLVVEDVEINAEIVMDLLDMEGITTEWVENGQKAVELFRESEPGRFDAILMDIRMPVMDGLAAAKTIRAMVRPDAKKIPIIALTANAFPEDVQRSLQAAMNAHLSKPVDPDQLMVTLSKLVGENRA